MAQGLLWSVRRRSVLTAWLTVLDDVLLAGIKRGEPSRRSLEGRTNLQEVRNACIVINTAEYCFNTSLQLEERVRDKIDEPLKAEVAFERPREQYSRSVAFRQSSNQADPGSVISQAIASVLRELEVMCEPAFAAILKTPWMHLENVSGRSAYIVDLVGSVKQIAEVVRARVESKKYIRNFSDKAVGSADSFAPPSAR